MLMRSIRMESEDMRDLKQELYKLVEAAFPRGSQAEALRLGGVVVPERAP